MDMTFEEMVRERAYHIWMAAGMQDGLAHEHWTSAEQAIVREAPKPAKAPKKAAAKATSTKAASTKKPAASKAAPAKTIAKKATAKSSKAKH